MSNTAKDDAKVSRGGYLQSGSPEKLQVEVEDKAPCKWDNFKSKVWFNAKFSITTMGIYITTRVAVK